MIGQAAVSGAARNVATTFATLVAAEGSAGHAHLRLLMSLDGPWAGRDVADVVHHLSMLHSRHPGVVDHAAARTADAAARQLLEREAAAFAGEREFLARLVVAVGPVPSTPGQAESEVSMLAQRHAIEMLAQSDRQGCALGAALAMLLDWQALRPLLVACAARFAAPPPSARLAGAVLLEETAHAAAVTPALERALLFGAQQVTLQHRGLWDLLEARAAARNLLT